MSEVMDGVRIVSVHSDKPTYRLHDEELTKILLSDEVKDLPVAVISVAGAFRGGKSFLLNFFLRYLSATPSARANGTWLKENEDVRLTGFSWRGGSERNTKGILMWPEPFIVTTDSGKRVAVFLMDTQGTFDSSSTYRDNSTIFALSTLLSSTQIYNLKENIKEDDLSNLELFTNYGKLMKEESGKAFQVLEFLIRDWMNPSENSYGQAGGENFLRNKLMILPTQPVEAQELRRHIVSSFEKVTCFLMPHPGLGIIDPNFKGRSGEISPPFLMALKELASSIFSPDNLVIKQVAGEPVKSRELYNYFKTYMTIFNSDEIPTPMTVLAATAEAGILMAFNEAREQYTRNMDLACGTDNALSMPADMVRAIHNQQKAAARATFKSKKLFGKQNEINRKLEELINEMNKRENDYLEINKSKTKDALEAAKTAYQVELSKVTEGRLLCVHARDLRKIHDDALELAKAKFDKLRKKLPPGTTDDVRESLIEDFKNEYIVLRLQNEQNNQSNATEVKNEYFNKMVLACNQEPKLNEDQFKDENDKAYAEALADFDSRRNKTNVYDQDVFRDNLERDLEFQYKLLKQINTSVNNKGFQLAMVVYDQSTITVGELREHCLHPDDLMMSHNAAVCSALMAFRPTRECKQGFDDSDKDEKLLNNLFKNRYEALEDINKTANEMAVQVAYGVYKAKYYQLSDHWYYIFQTWETAHKYHQEALDKALESFYSKRRNRNWHETDTYLSDLKSKCQHYYNPYNKS